jgi:hypothetical protein
VKSITNRSGEVYANSPGFADGTVVLWMLNLFTLLQNLIRTDFDITDYLMRLNAGRAKISSFSRFVKSIFKEKTKGKDYVLLIYIWADQRRCNNFVGCQFTNNTPTQVLGMSEVLFIIFPPFLIS